MARHVCHAHGCSVPVPPAMFMCRRHWYSLPKLVRDAIWREYRPGQENDKNPSARYMAVHRFAVARAAFKPNDEQAAAITAHYMAEALRWQEYAIAAGHGDPLADLLPARRKDSQERAAERVPRGDAPAASTDHGFGGEGDPPPEV